MNKQQTAVEWFAFELSKLGLLPDGVPDDIYKQAKEMEKEQIMEAHYAPKYGCFSEHYYNETYGGNK